MIGLDYSSDDIMTLIAGLLSLTYGATTETNEQKVYRLREWVLFNKLYAALKLAIKKEGNS